jgi:hypothetical protein
MLHGMFSYWTVSDLFSVVGEFPIKFINLILFSEALDEGESVR